MGILDAIGVYSRAQALTVTANSTNEVNHAVANANQGAGNPVHINCHVNVALTGGTNLTAAWRHSATSASGFVDRITGPLTLTAALLEGADLLPGAILPVDHLQFSDVNYTITGVFVAGSVDAYLALHRVDNT